MRLFFDKIFTDTELETLTEAELIALESSRVAEQEGELDALRLAYTTVHPEEEPPAYVVVTDNEGAFAVKKRVTDGEALEQSIVMPRGTDLYAYFNAL